MPALEFDRELPLMAEAQFQGDLFDGSAFADAETSNHSTLLAQPCSRRNPKRFLYDPLKCFSGEAQSFSNRIDLK